MSTEDGPGLRTTLFVKGCPLQCRWCHNPESIAIKPQLEWLEVRCMGCGTCIQTCPNKALTPSEKGILIDRNICLACGKCVEECPTGALEIKGKSVTVDEVFKELIKDEAYFGQDGGVTLSGGEITMQAEEATLLLKKLKELGIGTALDTCGLTTKERLDMLFPYVDVFLYDVKIFDSQKHKEFTGVDNTVILDNFNYLAEKIKGTNKQLWVRTPIIPKATDSDENIRSIAQFIKGKFHRWDFK